MAYRYSYSGHVFLIDILEQGEEEVVALMLVPQEYDANSEMVTRFCECEAVVTEDAILERMQSYGRGTCMVVKDMMVDYYYEVKVPPMRGTLGEFTEYEFQLPISLLHANAKQWSLAISDKKRNADSFKMFHELGTKYLISAITGKTKSALETLILSQVLEFYATGIPTKHSDEYIACEKSDLFKCYSTVVDFMEPSDPDTCCHTVRSQNPGISLIDDALFDSDLNDEWVDFKKPMWIENDSFVVKELPSSPVKSFALPFFGGFHLPNITSWISGKRKHYD